jgi:flagellar motor switch protein FliM
MAQPESTVSVQPAPAATTPTAQTPIPVREALNRKRAVETSTLDLSRSIGLSPGRLRKLRQRHDEWAGSLAAQLSIYLRLEFALQVSQIDAIPYRALVDSLPESTLVTLFKLDPLRGICLCEIPHSLGLSLVDRQMGGPGNPPREPREPSEIESALLIQVVQMILTEWCEHWRDLQTLRPTILGQEMSPRFLQTASPETTILRVQLAARMGENADRLQICFPVAAIEPLVEKLGVPLGRPEQPAAEPSTSSPQLAAWKPELDGVEIPMTACCPAIEVKARELLQLKLGDVLMLGAGAIEKIQITLATKPKFLGRLGTRGPKWAVEITELLKPEMATCP